MNLKQTDEYEEMAAAYQCLQIQTLYQTLKSNGLNDQLIRKICEDFTFSFGAQNDQCWIESENGKVFPFIGFTKTHRNSEPDDLYTNTGLFSFSEYAFGNIDWFFEDHAPDSEPQRYGKADEK